MNCACYAEIPITFTCRFPVYVHGNCLERYVQIMHFTSDGNFGCRHQLYISKRIVASSIVNQFEDKQSYFILWSTRWRATWELIQAIHQQNFFSCDLNAFDFLPVIHYIATSIATSIAISIAISIVDIITWCYCYINTFHLYRALDNLQGFLQAVRSREYVKYLFGLNQELSVHLYKLNCQFKMVSTHPVLTVTLATLITFKLSTSFDLLVFGETLNIDLTIFVIMS